MTTSRSLERRAYARLHHGVARHRAADVVDRHARRRTAATAAAAGAGRIMPARLSRIGLVLRALAGRAGRDPQAAERHVPVGMDCVGCLLPEERQPMMIAAQSCFPDVSQRARDVRSRFAIASALRHKPLRYRLIWWPRPDSNRDARKLGCRF